MPIEQRLTALLLSVGLLLATLNLIRQRRLREEYALLWLGASGAIVVLVLSIDLVRYLGLLFEVTYTPTLFLAFGLFFALTLLISHSVIVTRLSDQARDLAQSISILDWQLRELEGKVAQAAGSTPAIRDNIGIVAPAEEPTSLPAVTGARFGGDGRTRGKVLVVGLDGATLDLIEPWAAEGYLPVLNRLMQQGAYGKLRSTIPPITAPAWTSFATGTNPGKHGLFDWVARRPNSYSFVPTTALDCQMPTIYSLLSQLGRRVCVLNVPMTYPPPPVNGLVVAGLPAPSTRVTLTYPPTLYEEMIQAIGDYILYPDPGQAYSDAGVDDFLQRLHRSGELRIRAFDYLRGRADWDFAMVVFSGTDTVSHATWKYMDPTHPLHDPNKFAKYGTAIRDYYRFVDQYLGRLVESLDDDTTLIVMSDHGFGPFHKFIHVNNWLRETGLMRLRPNARSQLKGALFRAGFTPMNVYDTLMRLGLGSLKREVVRGQGRDLLKTFFLSLEDVNWHNTRAYSLGNVGQINLNVAGREPKGNVRPGEEYELIREVIIKQLADLSDPDTGETVVESIYRREEVYTGDQLHKAPDILFIPRRLEYFGFGEYEFGSHKVIEAMRRGISGTHRMDGVFLAYGSKIRSGARAEGAQIVDLAPTILLLMGESIPQHMDGRPLREVIHDIPESITPSGRSGPWLDQATGNGEQFTAEEEAILAERLRSLGYVG